ncbi:MAG: glutamate--tRNA ligase [Patescibacteria group bacterium]
MSKIRTRFAPSPTGFLHIGSLRTALYSYLLAQKNGGDFILRLEDTDMKRFVEGASEAIYNGLKWAGIKYSEGPDVGGDFGPYVQSQRLEIYKKYALELVDKGLAYYCFCDSKTLEEMRQEQTAKKQAPKYDRRCLKLSKEEIAQKLSDNTPFVIRMKMPTDRVVEIDDLVWGKVSYNTNDLDDQVLLKSDGYPTYHLAVVVDDHLMKISHVTRTEEWLPSTPKHILLYEYFGWEAPKWAHLPLLLNTDRTKMSKRKGDVAVEDYIKKGYLPEAMINYLAFLGWNPGTEKEIYSMEELIKDFDLKKIHKAGAVFDIEKLDYLNGYYIRQKSLDELMKLCKSFLAKEWEAKGEEYIKKVIALEQERLKKLSDISEAIEFFFADELKYEPELLIWKKLTAEQIKKNLEEVSEQLEKIPEKNWVNDSLEEAMITYIKAKELKTGDYLWPMRVALTGRKASPSPFDVAEVLGKEESLKRIKFAMNLL